MRFHSTPESAINGEITKLAILECVVSVAIYVWIGFQFGTFKYLATAVVVAPLMLFRTEASADWGLKIFKRYTELVDRKNSGLAYDFLTLIVLLPIVGVAVRIIATLYWAIRAPLQTLREMPQNWLRQSLCTDFFHAPELLPLEAVKWEKEDVLSFNGLWRAVIEEETTERKVASLIIYSPIFLIGYLPPLIYRVSFKATAIAYLPFIWVTHATLRNPMPTNLRLERITKGELEKVRRVLSWGIIATLAAKLGFAFGLVDWSRIEEKFPSKKLVESLVVPAGWPWWQITLAVDAVLTFFLLFFADAAFARLNTPQSWSEQRVIGTVSTISFIRAVLSLVTISHFFRIALLAVTPGHLHRLLAG